MTCRICGRHIDETSEQTRAITGIPYKDTKGGAHCLSRDTEYLKMEDSPFHAVKGNDAPPLAG